MASVTNNNSSSDDDTDVIYVFDITKGSFPDKLPSRIENGDTIEFQISDKNEYDLIQVYKDDNNDYYQIIGGFQLLNLRNDTSKLNRRLPLSYALNQTDITLYFCIYPTTERSQIDKLPKCPKEYCEKNTFVLHRNEIKFILSDNREGQQVFLNKGDTIELEWTSKRAIAYRVEERKFCPVSGGLYKIEQTSDLEPNRAVPSGKFTKTFNEIGTSFLFRLTETNQIHDIFVCLIRAKCRIHIVEINDVDIQPNVISIEQNDSILFRWNTKQKQKITQIEPFIFDNTKNKSIELKTKGEHFFWPNDPSNCGSMTHQFNDTGVFCFITDNNKIGTIVVEPKINIHCFPVFGDRLIQKIQTNDVVEFQWKTTDSPDDPILLTIDANSSVVPDSVGGLTGIFNCTTHKCTKVEPFFRQYFHTCETFLLTISVHGLYNFAYSDNRDDVLLSVIVESRPQNHHLLYNERNQFEPNTLIINRYDQVWFNPVSNSLANIYHTDEYGVYLDIKKPIFQPQINGVNYYVKKFSEMGIYYFSTDINRKNNKTKDKSPPLAIIVLPEIRFHYKLIRLSDFDSHAIITNINDFVIWQFEQIVRFNLIQLRSNESLQDLASCHDRSVPGRNRQCIGVECIMSGTFYFANPEFERVSGSEQDRLISTIIIDSPFHERCFLIADQKFVPNILHVAQNETVSWILLKTDQNHRIYVENVEDKREKDDNNRIDRAIDQNVHDVHYLYTFEQAGEFTIKSNRFNHCAKVIVYSNEVIEAEKKRLQKLLLIEDIEPVSEYGKRVHLKSPSDNATICYTLDGALPTQHYENVRIYDSNEGISFYKSGLHVLRAYAFADGKISSGILTSNPTFVLEDEELERLHVLQSEWKSTKITLSASIQYPNKLYGKIDVNPPSSTELIDHFELFVDDVAQRVNLAPTDVKFSAEGFAGGEEYEIYIVAYPKENLRDIKPIQSNKRAFEIKREIQTGAPLLSLAVSNEQSTIFVMWAHIGDHVSEYVVYVDKIETTIIHEKDFNDFFGIQFHGAQQRKRYLIHVEAKIKNSKEIKKSNVIAVKPPLEMSLKDQLIDRYFAYITVNAEAPPPDMRLEVIHLDQFPHRRPEPQRKIENVPITNGLRNSIPVIAYKKISNGIMLFWTKRCDAILESVENYRIMVDGKQYGELVLPHEDPRFQLKLPLGKHECYVDVIPKDADQEVYKSNTLIFDLSTADGSESDEDNDANGNAEKLVLEKDIPVPKLRVLTMDSSTIRASWFLDRPIPSKVNLSVYEVHLRGKEFPEDITSDQKYDKDGDTEHVWYVTSSPLDINGISNQYEYTVFVRVVFTSRGSKGRGNLTTMSNEVTTAGFIPLIDLVPKPVLQIKNIGLQIANFIWKFDDSIDQSIIKGYRIIVNNQPTEILSANEREYQLRNLKPGVTYDIQLSVTCFPDFLNEKVSEPLRIICPQRPKPPVIQQIKSEKPFSIDIKWDSNRDEPNEVTSFKVFLDKTLHSEINTNGKHSFKYEFSKLTSDQTYSIYIQSLIKQKQLNDSTYQCDMESNPSNELLLKCLIPPKGTQPKVERMHLDGIDIVWDAPQEHEDIQVTGYQILKNGRAIGKPIPINKRRASIHDLKVGNHYQIQIVPITNLPDGNFVETGEEYDPERHGHYLPGPVLDIDFVDLVSPPSKFWVENISGHSAMICWSPVDESVDINTHPDSYKLFFWNTQEQTRDQATVVILPKNKTSYKLKDLRSATKYEVQLEALKQRTHKKTNETFPVSSLSTILIFNTGSPPDAPQRLYVVACTNTTARIRFDPFVEHNAEIIILRVHCQSTVPNVHEKDIILDLTPDSTEFVLLNLMERTTYDLAIYAITDEYLQDVNCRDIRQLPKALKTSDWLVSKSLRFTTSGCQPASQIHIRSATVESIELDWILPVSYGSTRFLGQTLRWRLDHTGDEHTLDLDCSTAKATIPGILPSGLYNIYLDSNFSMKLNLDDDDINEASRKDICLTTSQTVLVRFRLPGLSERPELCLTGYSSSTIDLTWNKPNMFTTIDHPEKLNEQIQIHRKLLGYRVEINGRKYNTLDEDQYQCTLTECEPGEEYKVQLVARSLVQREYLEDIFSHDRDNDQEPDETSSKKLRIQMLKNEDLLRSFQANFEFHHTVTKENIVRDRNEIKPLGKINVQWSVSNTKDISHIILQWHSSSDQHIQKKILKNTETTCTINTVDEKHFYIIEIILVTNDGKQHQYERLKMPIPGEPDAPKLWLVKTSNKSFVVEWSEPKSYGIPVIGFELYIEGKKAGDMIELNLHRAEIPSNVNRTYEVNICAVTNNQQRARSAMSQTLSIVTTPTVNPSDAVIPNSSDDKNQVLPSLKQGHMISVKVEPINENKLCVDWTTFVPIVEVSTYYVQYTCLNTNEIQTVKLSRRAQHVILRGLKAGFTYGVTVLAVDDDGEILYTSEKTTVQMSAPPNAPIVVIRERTTDHVTLEWRPAPSHGELAIVGYKVFINNRLSAILSHDQLTYTLTNGSPCDVYTVFVQALSNDKNISSPLSRGIRFTWPGIKSGVFKRLDDGRTGTVVVAWEHPHLDDETEQLTGFKLISENTATHVTRCHGEYDANIHQATIYDLINGKYLLWLEIHSQNYCTRSRPLTIISGRFRHRHGSGTAKCFMRKHRKNRLTATTQMESTSRHIKYS